LLAKQFVTVDQIDQAKTLQTTRQQALQQARSQLALSQARFDSAQAQYKQAQAILEQSHEQIQQAAHAVTTLEPLTAQRSGRSSAIDLARYNLDNCRFIAPFEGRVTNLTISEGAYAHIGQEIFTLIDSRTWWAVANFRETQLRHIHPGMKADVYVLSRPNIRFPGVVDSVGFGVTPDADIVGRFTQGLPDVQRTLNWVHLASRFPVRVRIEEHPSDLFRLSESAVVVIHGESSSTDRK
jgi:multidrug efflux system membrane fusion protein